MAEPIVTESLAEAPAWEKPQSTRQWLSFLWLALVLIVAPLKLGCTVNVTNIGFFPLDALGWITELWPPLMASVIAGIALLLVVWEQPPLGAVLRRHLHLWLPSVGLVVVCLIGLVRTTEWEVAINYLWMIIALPVFAIALLLHLSRRPQDAQLLLGCIVTGLLIAAAYGLYQRYFGFAQLLEVLREQQEQGLPVQGAIVQRLEEGRIMSTFTYPNNLAAHLLLVSPLALCLVWRSSIHVDPPRPSQITTTAIVGALLALVFYYAKSRAAIVAAVLGLLVVAVLFTCMHARLVARLSKRHWPLVAGFAALLVAGAIGAYLLLQDGRGLSSFEARIIYWEAAWRMFTGNPVTGVGLGEFFPWYLRLKPPDAEPTRIAHNVLFSFLSQTGFAGGLAALYFLFAPLLVWRRYVRRQLRVQARWIWVCMLIGWTMWAAHSFADFNFQIPGSLLTAVALPILCLRFDASPPPAANRPLRIGLIVAALIAIANLWQAPGEYLFQSFDARVKNHRQPPLFAPAAKSQVEKIARYKPMSPYAWETLGLMAMHQQQHALAADAFAEAVRRTPHRPAFHARLAEALLALGRLDEAQQEIAIARTWYPHDERYRQIEQVIHAAVDAQ